MNDERRPITNSEVEYSSGSTEAPVDPSAADEQDFALRNTMMSNALPGTGQPAAGAIVGSEGELGMQPQTDEERVDEEVVDPTTLGSAQPTETGTDG